MIRETRKILHDDDIRCTVTCVRVPVYVGHAVSANVRFHRPMSKAEAVELLRDAPGVRLVDDGDGVPDAARRRRHRPGARRARARGRVGAGLDQPLDHRRQPAQGRGARTRCRWPRCCSRSDARRSVGSDASHSSRSAGRPMNSAGGRLDPDLDLAAAGTPGEPVAGCELARGGAVVARGAGAEPVGGLGVGAAQLDRRCVRRSARPLRPDRDGAGLLAVHEPGAPPAACRRLDTGERRRRRPRAGGRARS